MAKELITEKNFTWGVPVHGVLYPIAVLQPPAHTTFTIYPGTPLFLRIPVYQETTADDSGNFSLVLENFKPSEYWDINQLIEVYDLSTWEKRPIETFVQVPIEQQVPPEVSTEGKLSFTYDEATNTISGSGATPNGTVRVYYIPYRAYVRIDAEFQTPSGRTQKTLFGGSMSAFVHTDLSKEKIGFTNGVSLSRSDRLEIKVVSNTPDAKFNPFKPDGKTLVDILEVSFDADIETV